MYWLAIEGGVSFAFVENAGWHEFVLIMIRNGSNHSSVNINEVLYGRKTVTDAAVVKMPECQEIVKVNVAA